MYFFEVTKVIQSGGVLECIILTGVPIIVSFSCMLMEEKIRYDKTDFSGPTTGKFSRYSSIKMGTKYGNTAPFNMMHLSPTDLKKVISSVKV